MSARHRLEYLAVRGATAIAAALSHLFSIRTLVEAAARLGRSYARLGAPRVDVARINLEIAFPDWSARDREVVLIESFADSARSLAELLLLQGPHRGALLRSFRLEGESEVRDALANSASGGVIALTAHFGSWELSAVGAQHLGIPVCVVHRNFSNPLIAELLKSWRVAAGIDVVALGRAGFGVLRALRRGKVVVMLADQDAKRSEGVFAPFFSRLASSRSGPAMIAMTTDTPVLPVFTFREKSASGEWRHVMRVLPPLALEFAGDDEQAAIVRNVTRMNVAIEDAIRLSPEHWMWAHRRWRTQPDGAPRSYPSRHGRDGPAPSSPGQAGQMS